MRGLGSFARGAVFLAGLLGASASFSQQDPRITVEVRNTTVGGKVLDTVTLSRDDLVTYAGYDIVFKNGTTNSLGRLYFSAEIATTNLDIASSHQPAMFEKDSVYSATSPTATFTCQYGLTAGAEDRTKLSCSSDIVLLLSPDRTEPSVATITVAVTAPMSGTKLSFRNVYAGGYEGNSQTGQGCCAYGPLAVSTALYDALNDPAMTYTFQASTFVKGDTGGKLYTGKEAATFPRADVFTTKVQVPSFASAKYDIGTITERSIPDGTGRCKQSKLKFCQETNLSLPNVKFVDGSDNPLIKPIDACQTASSAQLLDTWLRVDYSIIKGNPNNLDINQVRISYDETDGVDYGPQITDCVNSSTYPCICGRTKNAIGKYLEFWIKNYKNGRTTVW